MNFTQKREAINFTSLYGEGTIYQSGTLLTTMADALVTGMNVLYNSSLVKESHYIVNGQGQAIGDQQIKMVGIECIDVCHQDVSRPNKTEDFYRYWSDQ